MPSSHPPPPPQQLNILDQLSRLRVGPPPVGVSSPTSSPMATTTTTTTTTAAASTSKLFQFIRSELLTPLSPLQQPQSTTTTTGGENDDDAEAALFASRRRDKVSTFMRIPWELEKLMGYGFFQCADAFLYVFTFLPLRCVVAVTRYLIATLMFTTNNSSKRPLTLRPSDKCEILKVIILVVSSFVFLQLDTNALYHQIKSQSVIKLYIFFNMLEVGDRLLGCFSQDALDALFITATEQHIQQSSSPSCGSPGNNNNSNNNAVKRLSTKMYALICGVSILSHSLVILAQSTTLSVAINANNRALLTVMMSNNFVELKGSVFKKFDKMNLFQVTCSDIRERFHLFVLLLIVCLQTLREYSYAVDRFWVLLPDCLFVLVAEIFVDWLKHAFITRFNEIPLQVYEQYTRSLAYDMADSFKRKCAAASRSGGGGGGSSFSADYSDVVGRRLGFVPLPLAIVLIRVITPMWRVNDHVVGMVLLTLLGYVALASFRILNMIVLVGKAVRIIDAHCGGAGSTGTGVSTGGGGVGFLNSINGGADGYCQSSSSVLLPMTTVTASTTSLNHELLAMPKHKSPNSILKRTRTISGSDGDLLLALKASEGKVAAAATGGVDKKLKFRDDEHHHLLLHGDDDSPHLKPPEESSAAAGLQKIHLLANSNVSLFSVGFNEEMLKVEEQLMKEQSTGGGDHRPPPVVMERKHSLGSNLLDESVLIMGGGDHPSSSSSSHEDDVNVKREPVEVVDDDDDPIHDEVYCTGSNDSSDSSNDNNGSPLDRTVIERSPQGEAVGGGGGGGGAKNEPTVKLEQEETIATTAITSSSVTTQPPPPTTPDVKSEPGVEESSAAGGSSNRPSSSSSSGKKKLINWFKDL